jgi:hypothetical protein
MIECIWYNRAYSRREVCYINPASVQALVDVSAKEAAIEPDDPDETFCAATLIDHQYQIYLCHDAEQVAQAIARSLSNHTVTRPED